MNENTGVYCYKSVNVCIVTGEAAFVDGANRTAADALSAHRRLLLYFDYSTCLNAASMSSVIVS